MRHIVILLFVGIGGYFVWQFVGNAARVTATLFMRQHLTKVFAIVVLVLIFFLAQTFLGSTKFF